MASQWDEYQDFVEDAERDNRVGDHDFLVEAVTDGVWPQSSDSYVKVQGVLTTAGDAKADLTWTPPPPKAVLDQQKGSMERGRQRGIAQAITLARALEAHYGKKVQELKAGDLLRVKTIKTKVDATTGKGGFIRIAAILPMGQAAATSSGRAPF